MIPSGLLLGGSFWREVNWGRKKKRRKKKEKEGKKHANENERECPESPENPSPLSRGVDLPPMRVSSWRERLIPRSSEGWGS